MSVIRRFFLSGFDLGYRLFGADETNQQSPLLRLMLKLKPAVDIDTLSPQQARQNFRDSTISLQRRLKLSRVENLSVPMRDGAKISARLYSDNTIQTKPGMLVYFHGGGFVLGDLDTHDEMCRFLVKQSGYKVLSVDYRRAPEHAFPGPVEDAIDAFRWAQHNAKLFDVEPSQIAVAGDSAGGNLATVTALLCKKQQPPKAQLVFYAGLDRVNQYPSLSECGVGQFLNIADRDWFYTHYLGEGEVTAGDYRVSPLLADDLSGCAAAVVVTAGFDMLRDEGQTYAQALTNAGNRVSALHFPRLGHGFVNLIGVHHESKQAVADAVKAFTHFMEA